MIVVSDSSPLIILAKINCFDLLNRLFPRVYITSEVHSEVVIAGGGLPGATEVSRADWIEVHPLRDRTNRESERRRRGLGPGEMSTIILAKKLAADVVLLDDYRARTAASEEGLRVLGTVGLLEAFQDSGHLDDLRAAFSALARNAFIDLRLLNRRLRHRGLPSL